MSEVRLMYGSVLDSEAQCLVNPVNSIGVMGKGLALAFKEAYPKECEIFNAYSRNRIRLSGETLASPFLIAPGEESHQRWILMFPTKIHWRNPSLLEYLEEGMPVAIEKLNINNIQTVAWPLLGTGLGGLDKDDVLSLMLEHLKEFNGKSEIWEYE